MKIKTLRNLDYTAPHLKRKQIKFEKINAINIKKRTKLKLKKNKLNSKIKSKRGSFGKVLNRTIYIK
jgi:hypothetical protein